MTLILSHRSPKFGLFAAADIVTSQPEHIAGVPPRLPFHEDAVSHVNSGYKVAGTCQKLTAFGRTLLAFAGSVAVARLIISALYNQSDAGERRIDLFDFVRSLGLNDAEVESISLIYHYGDNNNIYHQSLNCEARANKFGETLVSAGSGSWHFFDDLTNTFNMPGVSEQELVRNDLISRVIAQPLIEAVGRNNLDFMYGGWFEIATRDGDNFRKIPYAVKFWSKSGGVMASNGPIYFGWYSGSILTVTMIRPEEIAGGGMKFVQKFNYVPDLLGRGRPAPPPKGTKPEFLINVVIDFDSNNHSNSTDADPEENGFLIEFGPTGAHIRYTEDYYWTVFKNSAGASQVRMTSVFMNPPPDTLASG